MRNLITFIVFFCFLRPVGDVTILMPPTPASNLKELDLKGPVKEVIEYYFSAKYDDEDTSKKGDKAISEFDRHGNLLNETAYTPLGKIISKSFYDYKKKDTVTISQFDDNNKLANKLILKYDDKGFLVECAQYSPPVPSPYKIIFKNDKKGNEIERRMNSVDGHLGRAITTVYNEKNQKIETDLGERFNRKVVYKYNELGYLVEEETCKKNDSSLLIEQKYDKHDKFGNWLIKIFMDDPKTKYITTREFKYF
jgi:hypothetical protein